jgi:hypothetical protein
MRLSPSQHRAGMRRARAAYSPVFRYPWAGLRRRRHRATGKDGARRYVSPRTGRCHGADGLLSDAGRPAKPFPIARPATRCAAWSRAPARRRSATTRSEWKPGHLQPPARQLDHAPRRQQGDDVVVVSTATLKLDLLKERVRKRPR